MTRPAARAVRRAKDLLLLADSTRLRIFEALREAPASPHQLAKQFGQKPTALYYHFGRMEKAGLIEVADTRQRRGTVERLYRPSARQLVVDRALARGPGKSTSVQAVLAAIGTILQVTAEDIERATLDPTRPLADRARSEVATAVVRVTPAQARLLTTRIRSLLALADRYNGRGPLRVRLTLAAIPLAAAVRAPATPAAPHD